MASVDDRPAPHWSEDRLRHHFGDIPAERIRRVPPPGTATEKDLLRANDRTRVTCELVDGTLVEKAVGIRESLLAMRLATYLNNYLATHRLGLVAGPDGTLRLMAGLVRAPDVSYFSWETIDADEFPDKALPDLSPDLAVEIISKGNTKKEIARKIGEYFAHGTRLVWVFWPKKHSVEVYTSPNEKHLLSPDDILDGGELLPGFTLDIADFFDAFRRRS